MANMKTIVLKDYPYKWILDAYGGGIFLSIGSWHDHLDSNDDAMLENA